MENKFLRWMSQNTKTMFWHDSAIRSEQLEGFENGAVGMTTNPFLVNQTLNADRAFWQSSLDALPKGLSGDEKVLALMKLVTGYYAGVVRPFFDKGIPGQGYVCAQTNPNKTGDADYMFAQAKTLASWADNIAVKLPATRAGIEVYEECVALGYNVVATVSFTVAQVLRVAEARERGKARAAKNGIKPGLGIAVMMIGRLDDYLRDVAHDTRSKATEADINQAGIACIKRAYAIFTQRGYDTFLMPAGNRHAGHISDIAGAGMICSVAPKIAEMLMTDDVFEERIDVPVDKGTLDRLCEMPEFIKAYEPEGMTENEFITFGSTNRTTDQFINDGWNPLAAFKY